MTEGLSRYRMFAEIASAATVALTLLFVGLQLRETSRQTALNTTSLQVAAYQDLNAQITRFNEILMQPDRALVFEKMQDRGGDWAKFNSIETRQARSLIYMRIRHADMAYYEFERGMLSEERLNSALRPFLLDLEKPVILAFWRQVESRQIPAFQQYINRRLAMGSRTAP